MAALPVKFIASLAGKKSDSSYAALFWYNIEWLFWLHFYVKALADIFQKYFF